MDDKTLRQENRRERGKKEIETVFPSLSLFLCYLLIISIEENREKTSE